MPEILVYLHSSDGVHRHIEPPHRPLTAEELASLGPSCPHCGTGGGPICRRCLGVIEEIERMDRG